MSWAKNEKLEVTAIIMDNLESGSKKIGRRMAKSEFDDIKIGLGGTASILEFRLFTNFKFNFKIVTS